MKSLIALQNKSSRWSLKCAKNQNCEFIRTYGGQVSHLLIRLSSLFVKEIKKSFKSSNTTTKHKNLSQIYIAGKF